MKALILIFFLVNLNVAFSQKVNKDSIFQNVKSESGRNFRGDDCYDYFKLAERKIRNDSLILPQYKFYRRPTETFTRWIFLKYKIIDWHYINGDLIMPETKCFDDYMFEEIENRFGKGFFDAQRKVSDSLDKNGLGYIKPMFPGSNDSLRNLINKTINIDSLNIKRRLSIDLLFEIDELGKVTKSIVLEGSPVARQIKESDKLQIKVNKIFVKAPVWIPARFLGKPIKSHYIFHLLY
jgi:hypothetical protein